MAQCEYMLRRVTLTDPYTDSQDRHLSVEREEHTDLWMDPSDLSDEGWELVAIVPRGAFPNEQETPLALFKRVVSMMSSD